MSTKLIYMDHSATTPVHPEVLEAMKPYFMEKFGNASSLHQAGRIARDAVESARQKIADYFKCEPKEIIFTSGGTESDNFSVFGTARANKEKGRHIITSKIEHHAILNTCHQLEKEGFEITYLPVDGQGTVLLEELKKTIRPETILISIMHANNEVGSIQPIEEIGRIAREHEIIFHTDAVQSVGKIKTELDKLPVDLMTFSGHKLYAPKGIGGLFIRHGTKVTPIQYGGHHEFRRRAGTENVPGIVGLAKAIEIAKSNLDAEGRRLSSLRNRLEKGIVDNIEDIRINGAAANRLPNMLNISFKYVEGEGIILNLDSFGICVSSGSACTSESLEPSHVLSAMGVPVAEAHGSIRFSLGKSNTEADIDFTIECMMKIISKLRQMSPLYHKK
ncbi:MAG: cysteine desulfurase NifS [Planctomycetes bacterium]|nr:cysteine desulfurase NifS [Planctomycetota bacterium]